MLKTVCIPIPSVGQSQITVPQGSTLIGATFTDERGMVIARYDDAVDPATETRDVYLTDAFQASAAVDAPGATVIGSFMDPSGAPRVVLAL